MAKLATKTPSKCPVLSNNNLTIDRTGIHTGIPQVLVRCSAHIIHNVTFSFIHSLKEKLEQMDTDNISIESDSLGRYNDELSISGYDEYMNETKHN